MALSTRSSFINRPISNGWPLTPPFRSVPFSCPTFSRSERVGLFSSSLFHFGEPTLPSAVIPTEAALLLRGGVEGPAFLKYSCPILLGIEQKDLIRAATEKPYTRR